MKMKKLKYTVRKRLNRTYAPNVTRCPGVLGDAAGTVRVPGRDGYVYYRTVNGDTFIAWNDKVQNIPSLPIFFGMLNGRMQIIETRDVYTNPDRGLNLPEHGFNHGWPGPDIVSVWPEQVKAWGLDPLGGFVVRLYRGVFYLPDETLVLVDTTDITLVPPATGAKYGLISLDATGTIVVTYGTGGAIKASKEELLLTDIPVTSDIPLWAVRLYDGQVNVQRGSINSDFVDLRYAYPHLGALDSATHGPATNTDGNIPLWDGTDTNILKDGMGVVTTVGSPGADTNIPTEQAVREAISALLTLDAYTPSNVTPDRTYDANSTSIDELADVLGTLIADLQARGLLG